MDPKKEALILAGLYAVTVLLSLVGLLWALLSGMGLAIDTVFLVLVCLSMGGVFSLLLYLQLKSAGLLPSLKWRRVKKPATAPANPSEAANPPGEEAK